MDEHFQVSCWECRGSGVQTWVRYFNQRVSMMCRFCAGTGKRQLRSAVQAAEAEGREKTE